MTMFVGMAMAAPYVILPVLRALAVPLRWLLPSEGRLAADSALANQALADMARGGLIASKAYAATAGRSMKMPSRDAPFAGASGAVEHRWGRGPALGVGGESLERRDPADPSSPERR